MDRQRIAHNDKLVEAQLEATRWKQQYQTLQQTSGLEKLTPMGVRRRVQGLKGIDELGSNGVKQRAQLLRTVLQPQVVGYFQKTNRGHRGSMRCHNDISSQGKPAVALTRIFSRKEGIVIAEQPSMGHVGTKIANDIFKSIGTSFGADSILDVYDQSRMSQRAY